MSTAIRRLTKQWSKTTPFRRKPIGSGAHDPQVRSSSSHTIRLELKQNSDFKSLKDVLLISIQDAAIRNSEQLTSFLVYYFQMFVMNCVEPTSFLDTKNAAMCNSTVLKN